MVKGLYTAYTGMLNEQNRLDVLSNNLANADTTGFKKIGTTNQSFDQVMAVKVRDSSDMRTPKPLGSMSLGVKIGEAYTDFQLGNLKITDQPYDLALADQGFFGISYTDKAGNTTTKLTRDGSFTVDRQGYLVTKDGDFVLNQNQQRIQVNVDLPVTITEEGNIFQNEQLVNRIGIFDVDNYDGISRFGENMYDLAPGTQMIDGNAPIIQGALESSNVNIVSEMVDMITITRAYEANQKIIQTIDSNLEKAANTLGKI